jgi:Ca2+-transporting ATPase
MLTAAAVISIVVMAIVSSAEHHIDPLEFVDPAAVVISIILIASSQAQIDYVQQNSFSEIHFKVTVIRCCEQQQIANTDLVVGDVILLQNGDRVPPDCLFISGSSIHIDNSQATCETFAVEISTASPFILSGAAVESDEARAIVVSVGDRRSSGQ